MESGLEGRNNLYNRILLTAMTQVSMESGLEGRNNTWKRCWMRFNEHSVSMESGLEGRNNVRLDLPEAAIKALSQWSTA